MSRDLQEGPTAGELDAEMFCSRSRCQNCGKEWNDTDLDDPAHIWERVAPGEPFPSGECPDCGALCQPIADPAEPITVAVFVRGGMVQDIAAPEGVRVIVLDFDGENEDEMTSHAHPIDPKNPANGRDVEPCTVWTEDGTNESAPFIQAAITTAGL